MYVILSVPLDLPFMLSNGVCSDFRVEKRDGRKVKVIDVNVHDFIINRQAYFNSYKYIRVKLYFVETFLIKSTLKQVPCTLKYL